MKKSSNAYLRNWAGISVRTENLYSPESFDDLKSFFDSKNAFTIRGLGKNYTDAGLNAKHVVSNEAMNRIISFDEKTGIVRVQSGVTLHDLLMLSIPKGWIVPTVPGTAYITMGGMIASNVHGKNQYCAGSVADHVKQITLRIPSGERVVCSPDIQKEMFHATVGGYGTTGLIEEIELALQKINTPYLLTSYIKTKSISDQVSVMESKRNTSDFTIGWMAHDALEGDSIRGLVEHARYDSQPPTSDKKISLFSVPVPCMTPVSIVNGFTTRIFNRLVYSKNYPTEFPIHFYEFNFKLDKIKNWNRLYGPKGFIQYQCLIPKTDRVASHIQHVLQYLKDNHVMSSLVVLKLHRTDPFGNFSFSRDGMSVAMDIPYSDHAISVLRSLNPWVMDIGGRVYLTKDRTMDCHQFWKMYDQPLRSQRDVLDKVDPNHRMDSVFAQRLRLRG